MTVINFDAFKKKEPKNKSTNTAEQIRKNHNQKLMKSEQIVAKPDPYIQEKPYFFD